MALATAERFLPGRRPRLPQKMRQSWLRKPGYQGPSLEARANSTQINQLR